MEPGAFRRLSSFLEAWDGVVPEAREAGTPRRQKHVAVMSLSGFLEPRMSLFGMLFGGTSTQQFGTQFAELMDDDRVGGIVIDVDSPGGTVVGTQELADQVFEARGTKPILAVANPLAASAALHIASSADRLVVTPSGEAGSVGVFAAHLDISQAMENEGVKETIVTSKSAPFKAELASSHPLSDAARQHIQETVDTMEDHFVGSLARNRDLSRDDVRANFGKGRLLSAKQAVSAGMADRIGTLNDTVSRMAAGRIRLGNRASADRWDHSDLPRLKRVAALAGIDTSLVSPQ
jgi:signal peptide peptidase SppA